LQSRCYASRAAKASRRSGVLATGLAILRGLSDNPAMVELRFIGGRLVQGESELARVGIDGSIASVGRGYRVVRTKPRGWHYGVEDRSIEEVVCRYEPLLVRRGGCLRSDSVAVKLRGLPLRPRSWRFATEAGQRIEVSSRLSRSDPFKFALLLRCEDSLAQVPNAPITLALGCWLIVNWENAPAGSAIDPASVPFGGGW
jgi:hypothetical protein